MGEFWLSFTVKVMSWIVRIGVATDFLKQDRSYELWTMRKRKSLLLKMCEKITFKLTLALQLKEEYFNAKTKK